MKKYFCLCLLCTLPFFAFSQKFTFAVVTDIHLNPELKSPEEDLNNTVNEINADSTIEFVLVTGDLTDTGDRESLLKNKEILDRLKVKYYVISGNHETKWSASGATDFAHIFGSERFDFNYKGIQFLGFRTGPVIRMMDGHVSPQDIRWLNEKLASLPERTPAILVTHYPLLPQDVDNWYEVTDTVRKYNIRSFIGGHYHSNHLFFYDGIPAFICRADLRGNDKVGGYSIFHIDPDSIIVYEKRIGEPAREWGAYSLKKTYYTADHSTYERPDYSMNKKFPNVKEIWVAKTGGTVYASPIVYKNKVYIGDDTGIFYCFSLKDGKKLWSFHTGERIVSTAAAASDIVVFGSADKNIYALAVSDGKLLWKIPAEEAVLGSATIEGNIVYIGASDHTFRAIDLKSGKIKWKYTGIKDYIETRPLIYENKVIFGAWDETMYALDKNSGNLIWKWSGGRKGKFYSPAAVWPVGAQGKIFFTAPDRVMTALDAKTGTTVWRSGQSMVRETIALSKDKERLYSKTMQDSVVCFSSRGNKPKEIWSTDVAYGYDHAPSMPVEKNGLVLGSTKNGQIFDLGGKTGKLLWKHKIGNSIINTVFPLSGEECVLSSGNGEIVLLRKTKQ